MSHGERCVRCVENGDEKLSLVFAVVASKVELRSRALASNAFPRIDSEWIAEANCLSVRTDYDLANDGHEIGS